VDAVLVLECKGGSVSGVFDTRLVGGVSARLAGGSMLCG
jgi:hypothetical protein